MKEVFHIYHTNDLHSHFENWPKIVQFLTERLALHKNQHEETLLFDIGDHLDRSHPITEASNGVENVKLLNHLNYDDVTIGNNEGITLIHEHLNDLYKKASFNVLIANLFNKDGSRPNWVKPYHIHELKSGIRLGVIGLTAPYETFYNQLGWQIKNPFDVLGTLIPEVKKQADIIVLLSHLGIHDDERVATEYPDIQIILGGHTHHHLPTGKVVNKTMLCGAYKYGYFVGYVKLIIDTTVKKITEIKAQTFDMQSMNENEEMVSYLNDLTEKSKKELNVKVADLHDDLDLDWFVASHFPVLLADALKEWCKSEIGMVNAGVLLAPLKRGIVTKGDIHSICPHPINPCKVLLKGNELKKVILQANTDKMERLELKGLGFRGKVLGRMTFSGVEAETTWLQDGERHVKSIFINGEPIDLQRTYSVGTIDMFTFGHLYPEIRLAKDKKYYMPELLRDVLEWKLAKL